MKKLFNLAVVFVLLALVLAAFAAPARAQSEVTPEPPVIVVQPPDVIVEVPPGSDLPDWLTIAALGGLGVSLLFIFLRGDPAQRDTNVRTEILKFQQDRAAVEQLERRVQRSETMQQVLTLFVAGGRPIAEVLPGEADSALVDLLEDILTPGNPLGERLAEAAARKVLEAQSVDPGSHPPR